MRFFDGICRTVLPFNIPPELFINVFLMVATGMCLLHVNIFAVHFSTKLKIFNSPIFSIMSSVIVVDNPLKDSVREYAQILDAANQSTEVSKELQTFFKESTINSSGLLAAIYTSSASLGKLSDKEFEPTFNLLIHIVSEVSSAAALDDKASPLLKLLVDTVPTKQPSLRDRKSIKSTSILSCFNTYFNLLPETSSTRIYILHQIFNLIKVTNIEYSLVEENISKNLIGWAKLANASDAEIKALFWSFINLDTKFSSLSLKFIKSFTEAYTLGTAELLSLIRFSLSSETVDISFLVNNSVSKALAANADQELVTIFGKYINGEYTDLSSPVEGLDNDFVNSKSKILALAKYFASESSKNPSKITFSYSEIPNVASSAEFEILLVNAIKFGIIEGKLNQISETFYLSRVNKFILPGHDEENLKNWLDVKKALSDWKESLSNINDIVKSSRENIVNSSA